MTKSRVSTLFGLLSILLTSCGANTVPQNYEFDPDVAPGASKAYYEIFVRSFADSDDDQIGDFQGLTDKVPYLNELGVGGVWLMPIHPSPTYHGYDVEDYYAINEDFGTLADFEEFVDTAHDANIDVIIDLVINHTSYTHPCLSKERKISALPISAPLTRRIKPTGTISTGRAESSNTRLVLAIGCLI
jgi:hypothetical protein